MKKIYILLLVVAVVTLGAFYFGTKNANAPVQIPLTKTSPTPTLSSQTLEQQIIKALSQKNNWDESKVVINIATQEGDFAKGDVRFKDEMGGGLWFAARVNGVWKIVFDGNGMVLCENLNDYSNFPSTLIPQCLDKKTGTLVAR